LAVTITDWPQFGGFTGEVFAFKAQFYAFGVSAVADLAKLVFSWHATNPTVWTGACLHFGAFFACYSTNAYTHFCFFLTK
jgi:hypothetical protein